MDIIKPAPTPPHLRADLEAKIKKFQENFHILSQKDVSAELLVPSTVHIYPDNDDVITEVLRTPDSSEATFIRSTHRYMIFEIGDTTYHIDYWTRDSDYQKKLMEAFREK